MWHKGSSIFFAVWGIFFSCSILDLYLRHVGSSSLTRDRTQASCTGSMESWLLDHEGRPPTAFLLLIPMATSRAWSLVRTASPLKAWSLLFPTLCLLFFHLAHSLALSNPVMAHILCFPFLPFSPQTPCTSFILTFIPFLFYCCFCFTVNCRIGILFCLWYFLPIYHTVAPQGDRQPPGLPLVLCSRLYPAPWGCHNISQWKSEPHS